MPDPIAKCLAVIARNVDFITDGDEYSEPDRRPDFIKHPDHAMYRERLRRTIEEPFAMSLQG